MGLTSLQVCMDSSEWFQGGAMHNEDESGMGSSSSPSDMDMLTCTRTNNMNMMERRLRPPHDQALKCPRCDSAHTKFCYYNNYSLSQPRYFCKTCRRYWTKGGSLRNIPVGGACRKTKKASSKKPDHSPITTPADLHLSGLLNPMETKYNVNAMLNDNIHNQQPWPVTTPIDFMMMGQSSRNNYDHHHFLGGGNFNNLTSPFGTVMMDHLNIPNNNINVGGSAGFADSRLMLPYEDHDHQNAALMDVKPKLLSLQWHDRHQQNGCTDNTPKDSFGYLGIGSWTTGMINAYGSSTTNPLI